MIAAFRADASTTIGNGHVMRCLTLADRMRAAGADCLFLCRPHEGHLGDRIRAAGFDLRLLPPSDGRLAGNGTAHAHWLGTSWQDDAAACRDALGPRGADWLVVDHYALDEDWERAVLPQGARLLTIDDLADRPHAANMLLDQNLGRTAADYAALVPEGCLCLVGPHHALLRPDFAQHRTASLARRADGALRHILIAMGGTDPENVTGAVLAVLKETPLPAGLDVTVVLGATAPGLEGVREQARSMPVPTEVRSDVTDMAALMSTADLAIGAAGGTAWERCCLGLPALLLVLADNQRQGAWALKASGAALLLGDARGEEWQARLPEALAACTAPETLRAMMERAAAACDGGGTQRVIHAMLGGGNNDS